MSEIPDLLTTALKRILEQRESLPREEARQMLDTMLGRLADPALADAPLMEQHIRVAALLGALAGRGETIDELAGFVDCLRSRVIPLPLHPAERALLVDTCGTGGDLSGTFNISTAAALVSAAAGARVAKHGNRAVTSKCGSADVLEALGIPVDLSPGAASEALRRHNFVFLAAPSMQPGMRSLMPLRRALGVRTAFNILGPMTNPAGAPAQVMGVYAERLVPIVAETLARLNTRHAFVVFGSDGAAGGMDEFSISGPTTVGEVRGTEFRLLTVTPEIFGLPHAPVEWLAGGDALTNAGILHSVFAGEPGPRRDVTVINAAAVLVTAGLAATFPAGARLAEQTIDAGKVAALVEALRAKATA